MKTRPILFHIALCLAVAAPALGQGITTHKVTDSIYMLEGRGGNIGVSVGSDGLLVIDTQYANMAEAIADALKALSDADVELIVNTHFHGDHTGGNVALAQDTPVVAHENVRTRLLGTGDANDQSFSNGLPWITFDDNLSLHFNGEEIELVHFPTGHTDTDCVVFFKGSNVVHMGDHFFNGRFPFIDLAGGGDVASYLVNVQAVIDRLPGDVKIIPGHGPLATLKDLKAFKAMLDDTVAIIRKGIADGKDQKALQKEGLPKKYGDAGSGFIPERRWISIVYQSYAE